ncbi:MAG TPA: hypothetical protein VLX12_02795 [Syntrophorhabdales bacterium]|nr:hypothetical protein [Syntrophorhabdales bacterium]
MNNGGFFKSIKDFLFGFAAHEHVVLALKTKASLGDLLIVAMFGDMLGLPIFRSYYSLRLLPHLLPRLQGWKRRMLRERDLVDALD